jgi:acylglycerol lipase
MPMTCDPAMAAETQKDETTAVKTELPKRQTSAQEVDLIANHPAVLYWPAATDKPKGALLCLHELGMHAGRFENLGKRMAAEGYHVYAPDLRGFGAWRQVSGQHAKMSIPKSMEDAKLGLEALHKKYPGQPVFVLGEAMGGAMALKLASQYPSLVQGVISAAPGGEHYKTVHNYMHVCKRVLTGRQNKDAELSHELVEMGTPKPALQACLKSDPWVRMDLTPKELMSCQFFMYKTRNFAKQIKDKPVLIVQGLKDGESKPEGATKVTEELATKNKQSLMLPEGDHYVYEDSEVNDTAMQQALGFMDKHATLIAESK